jgi:hypothetical protein
MEPSLRSSSYRAVESKLRRTDLSLHETTQRFVERLSPDVRISQYADIHYAAKKFESDKWYWLSPTGISGYLVFLPNSPVVWIDEQFKKSYKIPIRVSKTIYEKNTVVIASLNITDSILRIEDMWLNAGTLVRNLPFTQRWDKLLDFYSLYYKPDLVLQQGIRIETSIYQPLCKATEWSSLGAMMLAQSESSQRRLRVQLLNTTPVSQQVVKPQVTHKATPSPVTKSGEQKQKKNQNPVARAIPHAEYPDTYDVWIDGVKKGYAAVQDIDLSRRLREALSACSATEAKKELVVNVEWNSEFSMYEINSLL